MAGAHLSLTRRALLAGACAVPAFVVAPTAVVATPRHPELDSGPMNTEMEGPRSPCSWTPDQVRGDGKVQSFVVTNWNRALAAYQKADTALAAVAHTEDEALYDRLGARHERALQRLLRTPAPTIAALAAKLDLALDDRAIEFIADLPAMRALKADARRLS